MGDSEHGSVAAAWRAALLVAVFLFAAGCAVSSNLRFGPTVWSIGSARTDTQEQGARWRFSLGTPGFNINAAVDGPEVLKAAINAAIDIAKSSLDQASSVCGEMFDSLKPKASVRTGDPV